MLEPGIDRGPGPGEAAGDVIFASPAPVKSIRKTGDAGRGFPRRKPGISPAETVDFGDPVDHRNINTSTITIRDDRANAETSMVRFFMISATPETSILRLLRFAMIAQSPKHQWFVFFMISAFVGFKLVCHFIFLNTYSIVIYVTSFSRLMCTH